MSTRMSKRRDAKRSEAKQYKAQHRVLLFLILLALFGFTSCKETVLHNLDERQANQIKVSLARAGIVSQKVFDGTAWAIQVDADKETKALATLEENRLLKRNLEESVEPSRSFIPSREERARGVERQLSIQLEQTLERLPYVLEARVHLSLAMPNPVEFEEKANAGTASILLIVTPATIEQPFEEKIKKLVAGASGVDVNRVTVVVERGEEAVRLPSSTAVTTKNTAPHSAQSKKFASLARNVSYSFLVPLIVVLLLCAVLSQVLLKKRNMSRHIQPKAKPYRRSKDILSPQPPGAMRDNELDAATKGKKMTESDALGMESLSTVDPEALQ